MKKSIFYIYYLVMVLILALYVNMSNSPSFPIRLAYLAAVFIPLINTVERLPAVLICLLIISTNTFAFPFMPTEWFYYFAIVSVIVMLNFRKADRANINGISIVLLIYIIFNDLLFTSNLTALSENLLLFVLLFFCVTKTRAGSSLDNIALSFMVSSLVISFWILFRPEARLEVAHVAGDLEAAGWQDPNYLACIVGMGSVVAMNELLKKRNNLLYRYFCIAVVIISIIATASLGSRGAILALAVGIVSLVFTSPISRSAKFFTFVLVAAAVYFMYSSHVFDLLQARIMESDISNNRLDVWNAKLSAFYSESNILNWLFGYGKDGALILGAPSQPINCHNEFLSVLVRFGLIGFVLFILVYTIPIRYASRTMRPTVIALFLYLATLDLTLDPLCLGYFAYLAYFFYLTQYARYSRQIEQNKVI